MIPIEHEFLFGAFLTAYLTGWFSGYIINVFKQLSEKI